MDALVILAIAFNVLGMALAGLLGVSVLIVFGIFTRQDIINVVRTSGQTFALLLGGMIVARTLVPSGIFERIGILFLKRSRGSGKRFLLGLTVLVGLPCMFPPDATTAMLLAPVVIRVAGVLKIDFPGPPVVTAIIKMRLLIYLPFSPPSPYRHPLPCDAGAYNSQEILPDGPLISRGP